MPLTHTECPAYSPPPPPRFKYLAERCWAELPEVRPSLTQLYNELENLQVGAEAPSGRGVKRQTCGARIAKETGCAPTGGLRVAAKPELGHRGLAARKQLIFTWAFAQFVVAVAPHHQRRCSPLSDPLHRLTPALPRLLSPWHPAQNQLCPHGADSQRLLVQSCIKQKRSVNAVPPVQMAGAKGPGQQSRLAQGVSTDGSGKSPSGKGAWGTRGAKQGAARLCTSAGISGVERGPREGSGLSIAGRVVGGPGQAGPCSAAGATG